MLTLIVCLFLDFIHVQYKKTKNKNILLIKQIKDEKKSLSILNNNRYLLICWDEYRIIARDYKKKTRDVLKEREEQNG